LGAHKLYYKGNYLRDLETQVVYMYLKGLRIGKCPVYVMP